MAKYSVRKANYLINLEEKMSKAAQLWVSYLIACLPRAVGEVDEFPSLTFTFREVKRAINADGKRRVTDSRELKGIHKELVRTPLWYEDEKKGRWGAWLTEVEWEKEVDNFTYYFHPKLKPYLLNVKDHFTIYNYYYRVCLSPHGMKLYEILKSYQYQGAIVLDIEEDIKPSLGLANKYRKYYDFRRRVLDPVQERGEPGQRVVGREPARQQRQPGRWREQGGAHVTPPGPDRASPSIACSAASPRLCCAHICSATDTSF